MGEPLIFDFTTGEVRQGLATLSRAARDLAQTMPLRYVAGLPLVPLDLAAERARLAAFDARQAVLRERWPRTTWVQTITIEVDDAPVREAMARTAALCRDLDGITATPRLRRRPKEGES